MSAKHTPGPMRLLTAVEHSANAARRWREQYRDWNADDTFADGTTKGSVDDALNRTAHTPEAIRRIINEGWSHPQCGSCQRRVDVVVCMVDPWAGDGRSQFDLCGDCLNHAAAIAKATGSAA
jgi:bacterioferritin-associated ferredoxin